MSERRRRIKILTGSCKRIHRELEAYQQEAADQQTRIEQLRDSATCEVEYIRKQTEVLRETEHMIPDTRRRLEKAYEELTSLVHECETEQEFLESEELVQARAVVEAVAAVFA